MPFEIFTADHNVTLSQVASLSRMNLRSPYTDAILADSDVPSLELGLGLDLVLVLGPNLIDRKLDGPEPDTSAQISCKYEHTRTHHKSEPKDKP